MRSDNLARSAVVPVEQQSQRQRGGQEQRDREQQAGRPLERANRAPFREAIHQHAVLATEEQRQSEAQDRAQRECRDPLHQASIPSGFSTSRLNACISRAPSAPSIARWSKLPVALIPVAICSESLMT